MASENDGFSSEMKNADVQIDCPVDTEVDQTDAKEVDVCQFFLEGKCRFGVRCRLSHKSSQVTCQVPSNSSVDPAIAIGDTLIPDHVEEQVREKQKKKRAKRSKAGKPKKNEDVNKKPRMRTADDVISRILWDPSLDGSEFIVGYLDRFLGVLDRPFSDFNWDLKPCDCDYTTDLALPRHRIQYFSYRGHRVWDRHSRTDKVFGSTGQSLAPPFGGEEKVKAQEQAPAVTGQKMESSHGQNAHLEQEEHNGRSAGGSESAQACQAPACFAEEAPNSTKTSADKEASNVEGGDTNENLAKGNESLEGLKHLNLSESPEKGANVPDPWRKKKPTHFITFRANTPAILTCFQQLQDEVRALLPSSAPHWQTSSSLHVTMCLLVLRTPSEVEEAVQILAHFAQFDHNPPVTLGFPVKLKHFNGRVLYLSPQPQIKLQLLNEGLQEAYWSRGLLHRNSYNPRYHLTLAKITGDHGGERIFNDVGSLKVGKGLNFGRLPVNTLHLCVIGEDDVDGFYKIVSSVSLR
ncbi:leukocyte receptor cluster member 9 [Stigmatopora nigra]